MTMLVHLNIIRTQESFLQYFSTLLKRGLENILKTCFNDITCTVIFTTVSYNRVHYMILSGRVNKANSICVKYIQSRFQTVLQRIIANYHIVLIAYETVQIHKYSYLVRLDSSNIFFLCISPAQSISMN